MSLLQGFGKQYLKVTDREHLEGTRLEIQNQAKDTRKLLKLTKKQYKEFLHSTGTHKSISTLRLFELYARQETKTYQTINMLAAEGRTFVGFFWTTLRQEDLKQTL